MGYYIDKDGDEIWLADGDGAGWFALFIIFLAPFMLLSALLDSFAIWVIDHFLVVNIISCLILWGISLWMALKTQSRPVFLLIEILSNYLLFTTLMLSMEAYCIPYVREVDSIFECVEVLIVMSINIGLVMLIKALGKLGNHAVYHMILSIAFLICYLAFMRSILEDLGADGLMQIYRLESSVMYKLWFGILFL